MTGRIPVRIDNKGRISLPASIRSAMGVGIGDTVFLKCEPKGHVLLVVPAVEDPVAVLWERAEAEHEAGRTGNLRKRLRERSRGGA